MRLIRNILIFFAVTGSIGLVVAFFSLNALIKKGFEVGGPRVAQVETHLGSAQILPFTGTGKLSGILIGNPTGSKTPYAIKVDAIKTGVDLPSIKTNTILINYVKVEAPDIYIEGGLSGKNNLTTIASNIQSFTGNPGGAKQKEAKNEAADKSSPGEPAGAGKKTIVKELLITGAKVHWVSVLTLGQEIALPLPDIHLTNVGQESNGMSPSQLSNLVLNEVFKAASSVSGKNANLALQQVKGMGKDNLEKAVGGLKGLLGK